MSRNYENTAQSLISKQLETQLAEGRRLLELEIRTPKELERASARRSIWVENNVRLLKDCPLPDNVINRLLPQASLDNTDTGEDFDAELHAFRDITRTQMSVLENALALTPKPPHLEYALKEEMGIALQAGDSRIESISGSIAKADVSLKEKLERHPLGVAAMICLGCITVVFLIMTWYHGESEKGLINKYETQITGMKNDLDAQRRDYEEKIRKLSDELAKAQTQGKKASRR